MWLGGIAFALLAAAVISAVAMIQSSRPLPFETWARDLRQRAGGMPGMTSTATMVALQRAGAPESARVVTPTLPDHEPGKVDAAFGSHARLERSDVVIAGLGPILASAAAAERLAADLRLPPVSAPPAKVGAGAERVLHIAFDLAQEPRASGADLDRASSWCWRSERRALPRSSHRRRSAATCELSQAAGEPAHGAQVGPRGPPKAAGEAGQAADLLGADR